MLVAVLHHQSIHTITTRSFYTVSLEKMATEPTDPLLTAIKLGDLEKVISLKHLADTTRNDDTDHAVKAAIVKAGMAKLMGWSTSGMHAVAVAVFALTLRDCDACDGGGGGTDGIDGTPDRWRILEVVVEVGTLFVVYVLASSWGWEIGNRGYLSGHEMASL